MDRKKKEKMGSTTTQEPETNGLQNEEEQNQPNATLAANSIITSSPSSDNLLSQNHQQCLSILQRPQISGEQAFSNSTQCAPSQSPPPPIAVSQWYQLPHPQLNLTSHLVQQGQLPPQLAQPATPFWLPQRPGYHLPGVNAHAIYQPFTPLETTDGSWQAVGCGISPKELAQIANFGYQVGYPYPGFPGPWDPSPWWGHVQQSQPSCTYTFPEANGCFSLQPPVMPGCSASNGQSFQKGFIRPTAKLSQKHQQLWEAQSTENIQLWTVIGQLQTEIADYKSRMMKLETEVSSLKQAEEDTNAHVIVTPVSCQASKRGRPKRSVASVDVLPSPDECQPRARGRKPAQSKVKSAMKSIRFEKNSKNNPNVITGQHVDEKASNMITSSSHNIAVNGSNLMLPSLHHQIHQEIPGRQVCGAGLDSSSQMKSTDNKTKELNNSSAVLSLPTKGINKNGALVASSGAKNNGNLRWASTISSEDDVRNMINMSSQGYYGNSSIIRQGTKVIPGWNFVNEENASEELEDAVVASAKDANMEEMEDDACSDDKAITRPGESLTPFNNW